MHRIIAINAKDRTKPIHYEPKEWHKKAVIAKNVEVGKRAIFFNPLTFSELYTSTIVEIIELSPTLVQIETKNTFYTLEKIGK